MRVRFRIARRQLLAFGETFALFIASFFARVPASRELIDAVQAETRRQNFEFILQDPAYVAAVARSISEHGRRKAEPEHVVHLARKIVTKEIPITRITRAENVAEMFRVALERAGEAKIARDAAELRQKLKSGSWNLKRRISYVQTRCWVS